MSFYIWATTNGYEENLTIDRINNNGNYEPSNCRWVTYSVQASNKRKKLNCSTAFVGIGKYRGKFVANVQFEKKNNFIGAFETIEEAIQKRNDFIFDKNLPNHINTLKDIECAV